MPPRPLARSAPWVALGGLVNLMLGCAGGPPVTSAPSLSPEQGSALIEKALPAAATDRSGWTADIYSALTVLSVPISHENVCAVVAVTEQESSFRVDPTIPGLPAIAWREIDARAEHAGVPQLLVHGALQLTSRTGRTYGERIDAAKSEKDLSDIYEDFIDAVPLGHTLFADRNPIRTRGPMQVNVAFAETFSKVRQYPYPVKTSIADEVFTRRGSLYFGTAHLLDYAAGYDSFIYRFADFNAGQFASRNAAFQSALSIASGIAVVPDGALLPHDGAQESGATELAARAIAGSLRLSETQIRTALEQGKSAQFAQSDLYQRVFALAEQRQHRAVPRALLPRIQLHGPKISRKLTTEWYARRVEQRFERCLQQR